MIEENRPLSWNYCPECGSEEHHHFYGYSETHRYCIDCYQEWHTDIDYSEVVRGNLSKTIRKIKEIRNLSKL